MTKLTKAQEKWKTAFKGKTIYTWVVDGEERQFIEITDAIGELAIQRKEIIEKLEKMQDKSQSSASLVWNRTLDQAIKIVEEMK